MSVPSLVTETATSMRTDNALRERIYCALYRIRQVENEIGRIYPTDKIKSPVHLSIGQEAVSVGVCEALRPDDVVFGTYRGHALYLAKGGDLNQMIAELYGKATGCAKGKGGSMHLVDVRHGFMGTSAVVATTIPNAVGYAYAMKYRRANSLVVSFFGDGAVEEGVFYESLNFAALKQLPIIFICENNEYAIHTHQKARQATANLLERVRAYGLKAERVEDNDVLEIYERARAAAESIRQAQSGPVFIECMTSRWREHVGPNEDFHLGYRNRSEVDPWIENDQVSRMASLIDSARRDQINTEVDNEIARAFEFAEQSPFPDGAELFADLFEE